ncbi:MAG: hypothetical protein KDC54_05150 [Lewinella sp.]|nr:hypothetical protein [Lewinella sp.]
MAITLTDQYLHEVVRLCRHLMVPEEEKALRRWAWPQAPDEPGTAMRYKQELLLGFSDEATNRLVALGRERAIAQIRQRILREHHTDIINICPECGQLARTPLAQQCWHCGHDWH